MSFANTRMLWLMLGVVPLVAWFLWWTWRKRQEVIRQFVQHRLLAQLTEGVAPSKQKLRRVILVLAVLALFLALARPQWGFTWEEATQRGRDILVAIDTSRSMLAQDVQPNRLARAKLAALDLLQPAQFDRLGLIAFSGSAFLQCPLTLDDEAYRQSVQILEPGIIPQGGTAVGEAIETARKAFEGSEGGNHKVLIIFTDGEDHESSVIDVVNKAVNDGIKIFTVGVGTPAGELLRVTDENGKTSYIKDQSGNVVKSSLNEQLLREIATAAGGFYLPLRGGNAMEILYQKGLAPMPTTERSTKLMKKLREQYYWPLSIAILLLVAELFLLDRKPVRAQPPLVSKAASALLLLILFATQANASPARALKHYRAGEFKSALEEYKKAIDKDPADPRLRYNAGSAAYKAHSFDEALRQFQAATAAPDQSIQQQAFYNLANSEFRLGENASNPQEKMALWEQAVKHYDNALGLNAADADAQFNRDLVRQKIEELKKQQQQQQQQKNQQDKKDDQKKEDNKDQDQQKQDQQKNNQDQNKENQEQKDDQQDQQQNDKGGDEQKQNEEREKKEQEQRKQQAGNEEKKDGEKSDQQNASAGDDEKEGQQNPEEAQAGEYAKLGKMTPAQAKQLLDSQKGEEKALLFIPQEKRGKQQNRQFKDW